MTVALSIRQPWAWLIVNGYKNIENRTWSTCFRGSFLIHASKKIDHAGLDWVRLNRSDIVLPMVFETGGIVGSAEIVGIVKNPRDGGFWFIGPYGFVIRNARKLPFMSMLGSTGFFQVDYKEKYDLFYNPIPL